MKFSSQLSTYFKRHMGFRKAPLSWRHRDRDITYFKLLLNLAWCSVLLLTQSWMDAVACDAMLRLCTWRGKKLLQMLFRLLLWKKDHIMKYMNHKNLQIGRNFLALARDGVDAVINYVGSSTNWELHLRTVREIWIKEQQQRSLQTKCELYYYV